MWRDLSIRTRMALWLAGAGLVGALAAAEPPASAPAAGQAGKAALSISLTTRALDPGDPLVGRAATVLTCQRKAPPGEWTLPDFKNRQPVYASVALGDETRLLILDRVPENDPSVDSILGGFVDQMPTQAEFFNRLYFDANGNRNLQDDPPVAGRIGASYRGSPSVAFPPVDTTIKVKGAAVPYRFGVEVSSPVRGSAATATEELLKNLNCQFRSLCLLTGPCAIDGKSYRLALADGDSNGLFNQGPRDRLFLTPNSDFGPFDGLPCTDVLVIGGRTVRPQWDPAGSRLVLSPADPKTLGAVRLTTSPGRLHLAGDGGEAGVSLFDPAPQVSLPPGSYRVGDYTMTGEDKDGDVWTLQARGSSVCSPVSVAAGGTGTLTLGEPFVSRAGIGGSRDSVRMSVQTTGAGKEIVTSVLRMDKRQARLPAARQAPQPVAPSFQVLNAKGDVVGRGRFEFG